MAKRKQRPPALAALLDLLELKQAVTQHCTALKATVLLMQQGKTEAAMARLEGAVSALEQTLRGQCSAWTMACPDCDEPQCLEAWVDAHKCAGCGCYLEVLPDPNDG